MAKDPGKAIWLVTGIITLASVMFLLKEDPSATSGRIKATKSAKASSKGALFDENDFKAKFPRLTDGIRDAFMPVVARTKGRGIKTDDGIAEPVVIPPVLTMGESGWYYTGMAEVNSVPTAIVENTTTGDGEFLKQGQRWKQAVVTRIGSDSISFSGPYGSNYMVPVSLPPESVTRESTTGSTTTSPIQPFGPNAFMSGPIGSPSGSFGLQPEGGRRSRRSGAN